MLLCSTDDQCREIHNRLDQITMHSDSYWRGLWLRESMRGALWIGGVNTLLLRGVLCKYVVHARVSTLVISALFSGIWIFKTHVEEALDELDEVDNFSQPKHTQELVLCGIGNLRVSPTLAPAGLCLLLGQKRRQKMISKMLPLPLIIMFWIEKHWRWLITTAAVYYILLLLKLPPPWWWSSTVNKPMKSTQ